ncbi:MAG: pilus assembly protein PilY [Pseudomonadota bacterium]
MTSFLKMGVLATALAGAQLSASAADLDVFSGGPGANGAELPNVLFVIDNTANWNVSFASEMAALKATLSNMPENKFNVGIMLGTETGSGNGGMQGGYVRAAIRPMNAANKAKYVALINGLDVLMDKSMGGTSSLQVAEAWAYFSGGRVYSGNLKNKADYTGNYAGVATDVAVHALPGNALANRAGTQYVAPPGTSCAKNYIIYISNGANQANSSNNSLSNQMLAAAGGTAATVPIPISPSSSMDNPADEWTRFMKQSSLGIVTYTIDVNPVAYGAGPGWTALLKSMAGQNYMAVTGSNQGAQIVVAINNALTKIQSVNSVFAAPSLPASPIVQDAYLNQVYVGMFRPDPGAKPRWLGNLKQYRAGPDGTLVDADAMALVNPATGFIQACARSYWTPDRNMPDNYWEFDPKGACIPPAGEAPFQYANSNSPDGEIVEKGGQAHALRSQNPYARKVVTCYAFNCSWLVEMNTSSVSAAALGAADSTEQAALINWAKGFNVDGEMNKPTTATRPSVHGDVMHAKPLALSYGNDVVVYYGGNDGMLRAINGNRDYSFGGVAAGGELWSFMAPEFFGNLKRLRANTDTVSIAQPFGMAPTGTSKPYGFDGPITAYRANGGSLLFAAMRRGGRVVYGFDVSEPTAPALKWRAGCTGANDSTCTQGASEFGQTWSAPLALRSSAYNGGETPLLIMGGGYDNCEDSDRHSCTSASKGHNITVMDAISGTVVAVLPTERGVVGDVRIVADANGMGKYAYAADLGGNLYRINMGTQAPATWSITKIAALGCATADTSCPSNRKFMFAPSVIEEADGSVSLYIGSGDREKPLGSIYFPSTAAVANYFFKVIDKPEDPLWLASEAAGNCSQGLICLNSLAPAGDTDENTLAACGGAQIGDKKGWYLGLRATEQVVTLAATRFGVTTFSTHMPTVPQSGACSTSNLGTVHVYNLYAGGGEPVGGSCGAVMYGANLPPSPQKLDVCMDAACAVIKPMCIGCGSDSPLQMHAPDTPVEPQAQRQTGWYLK